jgi:hypothetical protein
MADASIVRHDTIVVPEGMSPAQVRALAQRKAQAQVGDDASPRIAAGRHRGRVALQLPGDTPWRRSYRYGRLTGAPVRRCCLCCYSASLLNTAKSNMASYGGVLSSPATYFDIELRRSRSWTRSSTHRSSSGTGPWTSRPRRSSSSPPMRPPTSRGPCSLWLAATSDDRRLEQRRVPVSAGTDGRQTRHQSSLNCRRITPVSLGFSFSVSRVMLRPGAM